MLMMMSSVTRWQDSFCSIILGHLQQQKLAQIAFKFSKVGSKNFGMLNIAVKKLPKYFGNSQSDFLPRSGHTGNECTAKSCSDPDTQILSLRNSNVGRYRVDRYTVSASLSQVIFLSLYSWFLPFISVAYLRPILFSNVPIPWEILPVFLPFLWVLRLTYFLLAIFASSVHLFLLHPSLFPRTYFVALSLTTLP